MLLPNKYVVAKNYTTNNFFTYLSFETTLLTLLLSFLQNLNLNYLDIRNEEKFTTISITFMLILMVVLEDNNFINIINLFPIFVIKLVQNITYNGYLRKHSIVKSVKNKKIKKVSVDYSKLQLC